ncbi:MAG: hypothetical protein J2P45_12105 [Candidatus Dormibacteraeota bacterium]|nr:hypothetical protein [Candidatus Dormibacteraeota bacterium]
MTQFAIPAGARFGIVRGISYGLFGRPDPFVAQARRLGAGLIRVYIYWGQVEPEPGRWSWEAVDALLEQLDGSEEVWVTVSSSSRWATRQATDFLPPSPARDPEAYYRFVNRLVSHCSGRVTYWQCDNEPSNVGLTWAGTAEEYVAQLKVMHRAVKDADPEAAVILGGATYGLPAAPPDSPERRFFDVVLREGRDHFDLFDHHLYAAAGRIPADVEAIREMMRGFGYEKPVVCGEYNGPSVDQFPEAAAALQETLAAAFGGSAAAEAPSGQVPVPETDAGNTPQQAAMAGLYERMTALPPQLQMFMAGCPRALEEKRDRINRREIVMRSVQALAAGLRRITCWDLAPEIPGYEDHLSMLDLFYGKFVLMGYEGTELKLRHASGEAFALVAERLAGVESVTRVQSPGHEGLHLFEVRRAGRGPMLVAWDQRDAFHGEDEPPIAVEWAWPAERASAVDALGDHRSLDVVDGRVKLEVCLTPVFVAAD